MSNPFMYGHASNIDANKLSDFFIDNDNSHIVDSENNVFISGNRGSGKSMLMRFYSFPIKKNLSRIGIHIECCNPFFAKIDQYFNENSFQVSVVSEHILVMNMALTLIDTLKKIDFSREDKELLCSSLKFYFNGFDSTAEDLLDDFYHWLNKQINELQTELMQDSEKFVKTKTYSYLSLIDVIVGIFKKTTELTDTHFMFLIDDAVLLDKHQQQILNTWVGYRNTTDVSFKIAITSISNYTFLTAQNNSVILENHDYITLDLERNFFSKGDEFYSFAKKVVERRLEILGTTLSVDDFFPIPVNFTEELEQIREDFIEGKKYPEKKEWSKKQRKDSASKFIRSIYFRLKHESPKANLPDVPYTGFKILTNISTGVIRNLLIPCNKMYAKECTKISSEVTKIPEKIQYQILKEESEKMWSNIAKLPVTIDDCTNEDVKQLRNILDNFGRYLKDQLLDPASTEKKILTFVIEDLNNNTDIDKVKKIKNIINIGINSGLLYTRIGVDHNGGKTIFYTPNRMLWVHLGLDPVGQNGRKNFPVDVFYKIMKTPNFDFNKNKNQLGLDL